MKIDYSYIQLHHKQEVKNFVEKFNTQFNESALAQNSDDCMRIKIFPKYQNIELSIDVFPAIEDNAIRIPVCSIKSYHQFIENKFIIPFPVFQFGYDFFSFDILSVYVERFDWIKNFNCCIFNLSDSDENFCCFDLSNNLVFSVGSFVESESVVEFLAYSKNELISSIFKNPSMDSFFKFLADKLKIE